MKKVFLLVALVFPGFVFAQLQPRPATTVTVEGGAPYVPPPPPSGGSRTVGNEWFAENMTASPSFGFTSNGLEWDNSATGNEIAVTRTASGGPQGRPYIRQTIANTSLYEFGSGWRRQPASPATYGQRIYLRFSFRLMGHYNQTQKVMIYNRGTSDSRGRSILIIQPWANGYVWRMAIDGGLNCQTDGGRWTGTGWQGGNTAHTDLGQWSDIQVEIRFSSAQDVPDGGYKIWRNNNNYDAPDCMSTNHVVNAGTSNNYMSWSGYHQADVAGRLPRTFDHADLRLGPTFDPNWHQ